MITLKKKFIQLYQNKSILNKHDKLEFLNWKILYHTLNHCTSTTAINLTVKHGVTISFLQALNCRDFLKESNKYYVTQKNSIKI